MAQRNPESMVRRGMREEDGVAWRFRDCPVRPAKQRHASNTVETEVADLMTAGVHLTAGHQSHARACRD